MAIPDSDPRAKDLDAAFAAAMDAPARPRSEPKSPPERDPDAPHGRDENGEPLAPYGWTVPQRKGELPRPKLTASGRKQKDGTDRPRTATVTPIRPETKPAAKPAARDWTEELDGLATAAWFGLSAVGKVSGKIPVVGKLVPEHKMAAQAFILSETKPQLVAAVNLAAQHNAKAAAFCQKLEGGDGLWALTCMFMVMPVLSVSATIWRGDEKALKEAELPSFAEMQQANDAKMTEMLTRIQGQITAAAGAQDGGQAEAEPATAG